MRSGAVPSTTRSHLTSGVSEECADESASKAGRPSVFYVSYDGVAEPLGRSQVLGYLKRLAGSYQITLISFEKASERRDLRDELAECGIEWRPLRYHRRPPVLSTMVDVLAGRRALIRA